MDPLFKKASADFDEGGAKGLLLNHLAIDSQGRIVFDSSDDAANAFEDTKLIRRENDTTEHEDDLEPDSLLDETNREEEDTEIDIASLGAKFFPDLERLDLQDICPSLKNFEIGDPSGSLNIPFLKAPDDWRQEKEKSNEAGIFGDKSGVFLDDENPAGFDDDDGFGGDFDMPACTGFGEGGEVWARDAAIEPQMRVHDAGLDNDGLGGDVEDGEAGTFDPASGQFVVSLNHKGEGTHEDILSYFDHALQKNWAGPEHWRIRKIKDASKPAAVTKTRKEKEPFEIDFSSPLDPSLAELIYTPASSNSVISLPKKDWKSKTRNLLPDDKHFDSKQLLRLFLKPKAHMGSRRLGPGTKSGITASMSQKESDIPEGEMNEAFWAQKEDPIADGIDADALHKGDYDANFFQDDGLAFPGGMDDDDIEFADARDHFSSGIEEQGGDGGVQGITSLLHGGTEAQGTEGEGAFGTQLVTQSRRLRPEYVQYARVAKKVDVRRLKEEIWKGIGIEFNAPVSFVITPSIASGIPHTDVRQQVTEQQPPGRLPTPPVQEEGKDEANFKFTSVMQNLQNVYPKQAMNDISTSFCFICLLHLANEKGLVIEKQPDLMELTITKDHSAEVTVGGD